MVGRLFPQIFGVIVRWKRKQYQQNCLFVSTGCRWQHWYLLRNWQLSLNTWTWTIADQSWILLVCEWYCKGKCEKNIFFDKDISPHSDSISKIDFDTRALTLSNMGQGRFALERWWRDHFELTFPCLRRLSIIIGPLHLIIETGN